MKNEDDEDEDEFEPDLSRVTPQCCKEVIATQAVFLRMPMSWYDGDTNPPTLHIKFTASGSHLESSCEVQYCPFCGEYLPEIIRVNPEKPVCVCTDGGYYCDTCKRRLRECRCLDPTKEWGPNIYDPKFGDDRVCECGHKYYRHFDTYENMKAVGCKYCQCGTFKEKSNDTSGTQDQDQISSE